LSPRSLAIDSTLTRIDSATADGYGIHVLRLDEIRPGWIDVEELLGSDDLKTALFARVSGLTERPADHICAEWMLDHRRLPDLSPANLMIASQKGLAAATAVKSGAIGALDSDKKAIKGGAVPFENWRALADQMYAGMTELLAPVIVWIDRHGFRPEKTLWLAAADRIAQSLVWSGKAFNQREFALELRVPDGNRRAAVDPGRTGRRRNRRAVPLADHLLPCLSRGRRRPLPGLPPRPARLTAIQTELRSISPVRRGRSTPRRQITQVNATLNGERRRPIRRRRLPFVQSRGISCS